VVIRQGDVYWADLGPLRGSAPAFLRPVVVVQNDLFNRSRIGTIVVCALTSNLRRAAVPGNVLLDEDEAGLPRRSVVNVSQLVTLDRGDLAERLGGLSEERMEDVLGGIFLLLEPRRLEPADVVSER
jgi:mRNA interferase MazF